MEKRTRESQAKSTEQLAHRVVAARIQNSTCFLRTNFASNEITRALVVFEENRGHSATEYRIIITIESI